MNNKLCSLIYGLIEKIPNLNKTEIVKLCYLADYNYYKYFGKKISEIIYIYYNHGPFSKSIHECIDGLERENILKQEKKISLNLKRKYFSFLITNKYNANKYLNREELDILDYVIREYGNLGYEKLTEISYETEPMRNVKKNDILDFNLINKAIEDRIEKVRREKGTLRNYKGKPPIFDNNDDFMRYQYKMISDK